MLSTMSRKSKITTTQEATTAYGRPSPDITSLPEGSPRVRKNVDVRLPQPLFLHRLERAVLLVVPDLPVDILEERGVSLPDDGAVVRFRADTGDDLELVGSLLDQHLERRAPLHDGVEPLGEQILVSGRIALVGLQVG